MRWLLRSIGGIWSALMILLMAGSLALSVAMTLVPTVLAAVSGVVESVSGLKTLATRARDSEARLARELQQSRAATRIARDRADNLALRLGDEKVVYRGQKVLMREAVKDTSTRVARRTTVATGRNIASTLGEALPVFGIAIIVAATAWELHDSCALMGEMRELDSAFNPDDPIDDAEVCGMKVPSATEIWQKVRQSPGEIRSQMRALFGPDAQPPAPLPEADSSWYDDYLPSWLGGTPEPEATPETRP
jgi:hypothetical protein